jgi:hypothetical protein
MRPYVLSAAVLLAVAFAAPSADEDAKYEVKVAKFAPKGKSVNVTEKMTLKSATKISDADGNALMDAKMQKSSLRVYVEKTIDVDEKKSKQKKYTRTYEKAKDVENDESENKPYQGRTILFELSDGTYKLSAEGKPELGDSDLKELADEANKSEGNEDEALYPKNAVKVGETWKLPAKEIAKVFKELGMDPDTVKGEGKLTKAYKKDGKQWGTMTFVITFKATLGELKKADGQIKGTIDEVIDGVGTAGSASFKVSLKGKQTLEKDCQKFNLDSAIELGISVERGDVK